MLPQKRKPFFLRQVEQAEAEADPMQAQKPLIGNQQTSYIAGSVRDGLLTALGKTPPSVQDNPYAKAMADARARSMFQDPLDRQLKQSRIDALKAGISTDENGNLIAVNKDFVAPTAEIPKGFVRLPNGKVEKDPTFRNPSEGLPPSEQIRKDTRMEKLITTAELNKVKRRQLESAEEAAGRVPQGLAGRAKIWWAKNFDPNNPTLEDWQKIKMVGTDAQLMNTALTKGAISDQEMRLFQQAAANDDITSIPRLRPVFQKLRAFLDAEESSQRTSFQSIYGEDPSEFAGPAPTWSKPPANQPQTTGNPLEDRKNALRAKYGNG